MKHQAKYVKPEVVHIGDVIRVTEKHHDTEVSTVGKVASREYDGSWRELRTAEGVLLTKYNPSLRPISKATVTLLEPVPARCGGQEPLPGMENIK